MQKCKTGDSCSIDSAVGVHGEQLRRRRHPFRERRARQREARAAGLLEEENILLELILFVTGAVALGLILVGANKYFFHWF